MHEIDIMDIGGFKIGQAEDTKGLTGCTVFLFDKQSPAGVDIRGGGPASRETPLLNPVADAKGIHALVLSGGSAFGLDAAGGVMKYLEERDIGFDVGVTKVPLVVQSCIFDLVIGDKNARPDGKMAYKACENASYDTFLQGNYGAGMGATVGKYMGRERSMKSGIGAYAVQLGELKVGAVVTLNALGDIYDIDTDKKIAGALDENGQLFDDETAYFEAAAKIQNMFTGNTTIGTIITNAKLDKTALNKVASMAHNGYGRAIRPVHTMADGDSIYAVSVDWDNTYILEAEPGDYITIARKAKGKNEWYIGGITDENSREAVIDLSFLPAGKKYQATIYADGKTADWRTNPKEYVISTKKVTNKTKLKQRLAPSGGVAVSIKEL